MSPRLSPFLGSFLATLLVLPFMQQMTTRHPTLSPRDRAVLDMLDTTTLPGDGSPVLVCKTNLQIKPTVGPGMAPSGANLILGSFPQSTNLSWGNILVEQSSATLTGVACSILAAEGGTFAPQWIDRAVFVGGYTPVPGFVPQDCGVYVSDFFHEVQIKGVSQ